MNEDTVFRGSLAASLLLLALIKAYYARKSGRAGGDDPRPHPDEIGVIWPFLVGLGAIISFVYIIAPDRMNWAAAPVAVGLRWVAVGLSIATVLMLLWAHRALGEHWSTSTRPRARHDLVTSGPYRWIRHPMYTNIFMQALVFFMLSANWFIGVCWLALGLVMASRIRVEEAALIDRFGDEYRMYMERTGRFLPRLSL